MTGPGRPDDFGALIVAVARTRDRAAFARLFDHFAPRLKAYLISGGATPGAAEDFAQDAMLTVWRKAELYDPAKAGAATWIFTIARNLRIDSLRREGRTPLALDLSEAPDAPARPDDIVAERNDAALVRQALSGLPADQIEVVRMAFFHHKPHARIATELNLPLGTVKSRIRLAMLRLRDSLGERP
ncbi:MAG: sigma-70 family RNA polymerase sigma factor [Caulobacter sp.]|nr:sigma-70 family RNA polymerase sigma factor [Caulobacter sp.]